MFSEFIIFFLGILIVFKRRCSIYILSSRVLTVVHVDGLLPVDRETRNLSAVRSNTDSSVKSKSCGL